MADKIRISARDLSAPQVDDYLDTQEQLRMAAESLDDVPWYLKIFYSSWFYLSIISALGAFVAWLLTEPFVSDAEMFNPDASTFSRIMNWVIFPLQAAFVGLFLGMGEGIMCRNAPRALFNGTVALLVGAIGAALVEMPTNILYAILVMFAMSLENAQQMNELKGIGLVLSVMFRGLAWVPSTLFAGMGQGVAQWDKAVLFNGILGGLLGGLIGGILFDPIQWVVAYTVPALGLQTLPETLHMEWLLGNLEEEASLSRLAGFLTIGLFVGLFVGLVEGWTKTAWLLMRKGPLAGKQFILHRDVTVLGSSPKAGIYLFKDMDIEPKHAVIYNRGGRFEIEDCQTTAGTFVNGQRVNGRRNITSGDQIELGKTVLEFALRATEGRS